MSGTTSRQRTLLLGRFVPLRARRLNDPRLRALSLEARGLLFTLLLSRNGSSIGAIVGGKAALAEEAGVDVPTFGRVVREIEASGLLKTDWGARLAFITFLPLDDPPANVNAAKGRVRVLSDLPGSPLTREIAQAVGQSCRDFPEAVEEMEGLLESEEAAAVIEGVYLPEGHGVETVSKPCRDGVETVSAPIPHGPDTNLDPRTENREPSPGTENREPRARRGATAAKRSSKAGNRPGKRPKKGTTTEPPPSATAPSGSEEGGNGRDPAPLPPEPAPDDFSDDALRARTDRARLLSAKRTAEKERAARGTA